MQGSRSFFRLSAESPGLPAQGSESVLILPVISAGNVSQLSADLLIHTLALQRVGIFDPGYHVPAIGGLDDLTNAGVTIPMELFGSLGGNLYVLQQRSPVAKDQKDKFIQQLFNMIESSGFSAVLYLVGADLSTRTDAQMGSLCYHALSKDTTRDSISSTLLSHVLDLPVFADNVEEQDLVIPGAGLARRLLAAPGTHPPRVALAQFVAEGDNIPDAQVMANTVAQVLKAEIEVWKQPPSWKFGMHVIGMVNDDEIRTAQAAVTEQVLNRLNDYRKPHSTCSHRYEYLRRVRASAAPRSVYDMASHPEYKPLKRICAARYPTNLTCVRPSEQNSKWCSTHEEVEGKLLKLYKRHTTTLEFDLEIHKPVFVTRSKILRNCPTNNVADGVISLEELRNWYADYRGQWVLAARTLETRVRHHDAFYEGGDAGHLQYLDFLRKLISDLEAMMQKCDELGYELLLQKEQAKWVQKASSRSTACGLETNSATDCGETMCDKNTSTTPPGTDDRTPLTPPPSPASPRLQRRKAKHKKGSQEAGCNSLSCPDEIICKDTQKRDTLVQRLCGFLQSDAGGACRAEVFATFFRRAIARSPSLFVRARTWETQNSECVGPVVSADTTVSLVPAFHAEVVTAFISSDALTLGELERLTKKLPFARGESVSAELIRSAIADVFRPIELRGNGDDVETRQNSIPLLGGRVYEKPWSGPLSIDAWDVMHQLIACAGCALATSRTFSEALQVRRSAFVGGHVEEIARIRVAVPACLPTGAIPRFPRWQDTCTSPEIAMRILNVWLGADNRKAKRSELKRFTPKVRGMKSTCSEHEERHWMYLRMRWSEERMVKFLSSLDASDKFTVLAQRQTIPDPVHIHVPPKESDAWVSRVRSGTTPASRRSARWTTSTIFKMDIFEYFHKRSPETKAGLAYVDQDDVLETIVMDDSNGGWTLFLESVVNVLISACGYDSLDSMLTGELSVARRTKFF